MHLLFDNIIKNCMDECLKFAKKYYKGTVFEKFVNKYLLKIKSLNHKWCKGREVPCTYWQAESFLEFIVATYKNLATEFATVRVIC